MDGGSALIWPFRKEYRKMENQSQNEMTSCLLIYIDCCPLKVLKNVPELKRKKIIFSIFLNGKITINLSPIPLASDRNKNNQLWKRGIKIQV